MQSELKSLSKIFNECLFRIPDYQRGYSWQEKQLKEFWSDIEQLEENRSHYTGVLTLESVSPEIYNKWEDDAWIIKAKRYLPLYVVDGQQRLTTVVILIQCITEMVEQGREINYNPILDIKKRYLFESKDGGVSRSYIFGYEKDNPSYDYLKQEIFIEQSNNHNTYEETIYTKNLESAKKYFLDKIKDLTHKEIESIYVKVTQQLLFNIFYIEPELDVFVTFETMNNRGKPLSHLELLKNRLIYLSTKFNDSSFDKETLRKTINESWKTVYHYLGKSRNRRVNDDIFLKSHFITYFGPSLPKIDDDDDDTADFNIRRFVQYDYFKDYLLEDVFSQKRLREESADPLMLPDIHTYALDIKSTAVNYYNILNPKDSQLPEKIQVLCERINRLEWQPGRILSLILIQAKLPNDTTENVLGKLERFGFLSRLRRRFSDIDIEQLAVKLKANILTPEQVSLKLDSECNSFIQHSDFSEAIQLIGKELGYYRWNPLRYFMFEYEQHLRFESKTNRQLLDWEKFREEDFDSDFRTIEHIYPQKGAASYWKQHFTEKYTTKEKNILKNSLGNLLPLSHPKNSSLGNKPFPEKKGSATNKVGYSYGCLSEIEVAHEENWTPISIAKRGIRLLKFMELRWDLKIGNTENKLKALGIEFIPNREGVSLDSLE